MAHQPPIAEDIAQVTQLMHDRLGTDARSLVRALPRARRRLPRRIYRQAQTLARAEPMATHPRLRRTLDDARLGAAASEVRAHLEKIDLADRRLGWWLGVLGGLVFNLLALTVLLVVVLRWRGLI